MSAVNAPVLSISMLVSNGRKDTIQKCMESLLPLRAVVPSELILVDTGCTDGSIEIAREYADRVVNFTWCNDFAAARNAGLELCTGEWFLYLDDDEWFEDTSEIEQFFLSGEYKNYVRAYYVVRNYENTEGTSYEDVLVGRLCQLRPELRFVGKVHEELPVSEGEVLSLNSFVHHYGYVYKTKEEFQKHCERNIRLLKSALEEEPENIRMATQLVQEYIITAEYEEALAICKSALNLCKKLHSKEYYEYLLLSIPVLYREMGRLEEAEQETLRIQEEEPLTKPAIAKLFAEKCVLERYRKKATEALKAMKMYLTLYDDKEQRGIAFLDMQYYLTPICLEQILRIGVEAVFETKQFSFAKDIFERIVWEQKNPVPYEWVTFLQRYLAESGDLELFLRHSEKILQIPELKEIFLPSLQTMIEEYPEKEALFAEAVKKLRKPKVNPELKALGEQMRGIIEAQIASGNMAEAKAMLAEVESMLPGEGWIRKIKERL